MNKDQLSDVIVSAMHPHMRIGLVAWEFVDSSMSLADMGRIIADNVYHAICTNEGDDDAKVQI